MTTHTLRRCKSVYFALHCILHTSTGFRPARGNLRLLLELELPVHTDLDEGAELLGHGALADLLPLEGAAGLGDGEEDAADPHYTKPGHGVYGCLLSQDSCSRDCGPTMTDGWNSGTGLYTIIRHIKSHSSN